MSGQFTEHQPYHYFDVDLVDFQKQKRNMSFACAANRLETVYGGTLNYKRNECET